MTPSLSISATPTQTPSITPTCARPGGLADHNFTYAVELADTSTFNFIDTLIDACYGYSMILTGASPFYSLATQTSMQIGASVYNGLGTSCATISDGYYIVIETSNIVHVVSGVISEFPVCPSPTPTPSKTPSLSVSNSITPSITPSLSITATPSRTPSRTPSITPTCARPGGLTTYTFNYELENPEWNFTTAFPDACWALSVWGTRSAGGELAQAASLATGQTVYSSIATNCNTIGSGYYIVEIGSGYTPTIIHVNSSGVIDSYPVCPPPSVTPSPTPSLSISKTPSVTPSH